MKREEVLMLVIISQPPEDDFRIEGSLSLDTLGWLKAHFGNSLVEGKEEFLAPSDNLVRYRKERGLSQVELAGRLGTQKQVICDLEHGRRAISKRMAKALAELFGTDVSKFI